jgi:hypothetical protein
MRDLYRYVWKVSGRDQVILTVLSVALFLLELAPLELQRRIVNGAVDHQEFKLIGRLCLLYGAVALVQGSLKLILNVYRGSVSEAANQRLLCPKGEEVGRTGCRSPVLMVSDLGLTFGHGSMLNKNKDSVSLANWSKVPIWKDPAQCVARLKGSFSSTLSDPKISEAGRAFLAGLLVQLTDAQLRDLFETARVTRRPRDPSSDAGKDGPLAGVDEWVMAFKAKRAQIVDKRCPL